MQCQHNVSLRWSCPSNLKNGRENYSIVFALTRYIVPKLSLNQTYTPISRMISAHRLSIVAANKEIRYCTTSCRNPFASTHWRLIVPLLSKEEIIPHSTGLTQISLHSLSSSATLFTSRPTYLSPLHGRRVRIRRSSSAISTITGPNVVSRGQALTMHKLSVIQITLEDDQIPFAK